MPSVARRVLGLFPAQTRAITALVPALFKVGLDVFEALASVLLTTLPAVFVRGTIVVVRAALLNVGPVLVVIAPVGVFRGRVHGLGRALARQTTGDCADHCADDCSDWCRGPGDGRADRCA